MANDFSEVTKQLIEDRKAQQADFEAQRELLKHMASELEEAGIKANDNKEYNQKSLELSRIAF